MSNKEGTVICAELGIPGPITVTDTPGWQQGGMTLIALYQETVREKVRDEWVPDTNGVSRQVIEYADVTKTNFVFRMDEESAIAIAVREKEDAERRKSFLETEKNKAEREAEKASGETARAQQRADGLSSRLERVEGDLRSARSRNQVMERDLAKLRQSLGEIRMKEILAAGE